MRHQHITFIGAGNMAHAIIGGLLADGYRAACLGACDIDPEKLQALAQQYDIRTGTDNVAAVAQSDIIVLAVKPQILHRVAVAIAPACRERQPLVISVAAGIPISALERWLGPESAIVRTMPNMASLIGAGAAALCSNARVSNTQREQAEAILRAVGLAIWVEQEALLDTVTALSGSGPAYVFRLMEALETAAVDLGLPADQARLLTMQTVFGAAKLALESDLGPGALRRQVTSPGGTTERALAEFERGGFATLVAAAVGAARNRAAELAVEYGAP
jgi:pyrroline-5-carboxylate reductase